MEVVTVQEILRIPEYDHKEIRNCSQEIKSQSIIQEMEVSVQAPSTEVSHLENISFARTPYFDFTAQNV